MIYADWLEERGDARAAYLRSEIAFAVASINNYDQALFDQLRKLAGETDRNWISKVGQRFDLVLEDFGSMKLYTVKVVKELTQCALMNAKMLSESTPCVVLSDAIWPEAEIAFDRFEFSSRQDETGSPNRRIVVAGRHDIPVGTDAIKKRQLLNVILTRFSSHSADRG